MIREQRHIEKLKQRQERKNSGGSKQSRNSKVACSNFGEEFPLSFYPSPEDVLALSLDDMVPISAFGECIPHLPSRYKSFLIFIILYELMDFVIVIIFFCN